MIENLRGIQETVSFKANTKIRLCMNEEYESFPRHKHAPLEIIMPIVNQYAVTCGNQRFLLREGDILLIGPGVIHSIEAMAGKRLVFQADVSLLCGIKELETTLSVISPANMITPEDLPEAHERIQRLLLEIYDEYFSDAPLYEASIYSKLIEIFVLLGRNYSPNTNHVVSTTDKQRKYTERLFYICDYIDEHFNENITLDYAAKLSGYSKFHFSRLFKQFTNVSFYKYVNTKKIENAEKLLIEKDLSITEVSMRCGFSSLSSFIRMFKIIKGCTPTEFKAMYTS